jgi:poly(3-hydroxybutyrate) depolymerase
VPAVALEGDKALDCPGAYATGAPVEGQNDGFEVAGQQRNFVALLPKGAPSGPVPLFVAFNGTGETGALFALRAGLARFAERGFLVLAPSSNGNGVGWPVWDAMRPPGTEAGANPDLAYFDRLVRCAAAHRPIDKNRIYVGGHSAGGIMTNRVLRERSGLVAGGIVASGVFSFTSPPGAAPLDPLFVVVTWGGDNDRYTGQAGGVDVGKFTFVEEASLASRFYANEPNVGHLACRGDDLGHSWLPINDAFVDLLLSHPKGLPGKGAVEAPTFADRPVTCDAAPFVAPKAAGPVCAGAPAGCEAACRLVSECAVSNATVASVLESQLEAFGFAGGTCGSCVANCAAAATGADDDEVLACIEARASSAACGIGLEGHLPMAAALNACCAGRSQSGYCRSFCGALASNAAADVFYPVCRTF